MVSYMVTMNHNTLGELVLILVVVDDGLVLVITGFVLVGLLEVLILVVVDDGLVLDLIRLY